MRNQRYIVQRNKNARVGADSISAQCDKGINNMPVGAGLVSAQDHNGITLIALVITIIVLLILAGVVLNLTLGENGILKLAEKAGEDYQNASVYEESKLNELNTEIDKYSGNKEIKTFEEMLKVCGIENKYTIEDLANNKDGILTKVLENSKAVSYIINNEDSFLDILTNSEIAVMEFAKSENAKKEISNEDVWVNKIIQKGVTIEGFDSYMQTIPQVTNEDSIIVSSTHPSYSKFNAFDKDENTYWLAATSKTLPEEKPYIVYKCDKRYSIYKVEVDATNMTQGVANNVIEIYISDKEEGDDSWVKIYENSYSNERYTQFTKHNVSCVLDEMSNVRRIKVNSLKNNTDANWWASEAIAEIRLYGI